MLNRGILRLNIAFEQDDRLAFLEVESELRRELQISKAEIYNILKSSKVIRNRGDLVRLKKWLEIE